MSTALLVPWRCTWDRMRWPTQTALHGPCSGFDGYSPKMRRYQGEVLEKAAVQDAFVSQVQDCQADRSRLTHFDWSACHAIFETILSAFE